MLNILGLKLSKKFNWGHALLISCLYLALTSVDATSGEPNSTRLPRDFSFLASAASCTLPAGSGIENIASKILIGYYGWDSAGATIQGSMPDLGAFNLATTTLSSPGYISSLTGLTVSNICSTTTLFGAAGTATCLSNPSVTVSGDLTWGTTTAASTKALTFSLASSGVNYAKVSFSGSGTDGFTVVSAAGETVSTVAVSAGGQVFGLDSTNHPTRTLVLRPKMVDGSQKTMAVTVTDVTGSTQTVSATATFNGPSTTNMVLWLTADNGVTYNGSNAVSSWSDQSGQGHHATQAGSSSQPLYVSSAQNSLPAVRFDGSNDVLAVSGSFAIAQVFAVFKSITSTFSYGSFLGTTDSLNRPFIFENGSTTFHWNQYPLAVWKNGTSLSSPFNLGTITSYMAVTANTFSPSSARSFIVGGADSYYSNIEIAEIIGYSTANSDGDRQAIEAYLASKYGL